MCECHKNVAIMHALPCCEDGYTSIEYVLVDQFTNGPECQNRDIIITPATGINTDMSGSIGRGSTGVNDARPGNYEWDGEKLNEINDPWYTSSKIDTQKIKDDVLRAMDTLGVDEINLHVAGEIILIKRSEINASQSKQL